MRIEIISISGFVLLGRLMKRKQQDRTGSISRARIIDLSQKLDQVVDIAFKNDKLNPILTNLEAGAAARHRQRRQVRQP